MRHGASSSITALHRVIVGVCSTFILILAIGSLFHAEGPTEDPETHAPLDPRGAMIGIPFGLGGLVFSLAGVAFKRRRRRDGYHTMHSGQRTPHRSAPRIDRVDPVRPGQTGPQARVPREQPRVFWNGPSDVDRRRRRDSD